MKVNIGNYPRVPLPRWFPFYHKLDRAWEYLFPRTVYVRIDPWDTYSLDTTLATVILPALQAMRREGYSAPIVSNEDVPVELHASESIAASDDVDDNYFKRFEYVLDEMIWAFSAIYGDGVSDDQYFEYIDGGLKVDTEGLEAHNDRVANGLRLFAKYYKSLWT